MSVTGHRNSRVYKEISHEQEEETSKIVQGRHIATGELPASAKWLAQQQDNVSIPKQDIQKSSD